MRWLWGMAATILGIGFCLGIAADVATPAWRQPPAAGQAEPAPEGPQTSLRRDLEAHADRGEWGAVWRGIPRVVFDSWRQAGATTLALLTGACWLAFVLQAVQIRGPRDQRLWAPLCGVVLGVLSIWPTLFLILWQDQRWNLRPSEELAGGVRYLLIGVGLREELAKLACFAPLLPFLVRARDDLAALLSAACVGLGFAMEENVNYIGGSAGTATLVRLLAPAPLHMAMTGLAGLALYRACRWPKEWGPPAVATFGVMVLAHAMYDAFLSLPGLVDYALVAQVIFVLLVYQFFRELRPLQQVRTATVSLTANFMFCVSLVAAATFVYLAAAMGWRQALNVTADSLLGQAVIVYLFLREMPEQLVGV